MENSKLERIEELYFKYNFIKLVTGYWSNHDAYDNEALQLALNLHCYDTVSSIQQKVWDIFYRRFCFTTINLNGNKIIKPLPEDKVLIKIGTIDTYFEFATKIKEILDE